MLNTDNLIEIEDIDDFDTSHLETSLHKILHYVKATLNCESGSIYLKKRDYLDFTVFQNDIFSYEKIYLMQSDIKDLKIKIEEKTNTLEMQSFNKSKIILTDNIYENTDYKFDFLKEFDESFDYETKSCLTVPLVDTFENETIGLLQLSNKKDGDNIIPFTKKDKEFISQSTYFIVMNIIDAKNNIEELHQNSIELESKIELRTKELLEMQIQLQEQAHRDPLTNLYNRRHFDEIHGSLFSMSRRGNSPLSILMIDIDNFKSINDTYGHHIGDLVIKSLSNIFINTIRQSDIAIRYGGEEFLLLLTNTNINNASIIAEKLRVHVEDTLIKSQDHDDLKFTISLGLSAVKKNDTDIHVAIQEADKALYMAKETGKNKIVSI